MQPQVGREDVCDAVGYVENAGVPTAIVADFIGQRLFDTTNLVMYESYGIAAGNWNAIPRALKTQAAQAAKTTSTTLTAAELLTGIITGNQGAAGAAAYTLPLATDFETALLALSPDLKNNDSFDFSVINISAVAAEDITMTTNTGWTLVGSMVLEAREATQVQMSQGLFRARRTAANTYTLYRLA
jgi:hypothetical protein